MYNPNFVWIPPNKQQRIDWLLKYFGGKYNKQELSKKSSNQLKGWIHSIRKATGR